jgi:hypothetical protein
METIISAAITGGLALLGVIITTMQSSRKIERKLEIHQAVTDQKIEDLTREVREHNNFAKRMPALEQKVQGIDEKINILHKQ